MFILGECVCKQYMQTVELERFDIKSEHHINLSKNCK